MQDVIGKLANRDNSAAGDYVQDGILMCGVCHTPKQAIKELPNPNGGTFSRLVPVTCLCEEKGREELEAKNKKQQFNLWMAEQHDKYGVSDRSYGAHTFAKDDRRDAALSDACRRYVERWEEMKADNMGVLFHGSVGTGKSFYACAIANALLEQCVPATVTNFPRLLNILQGVRDRQEYIDHLQAYHLLVIDDLGVERESSYAAEQVYNVIDTRARSGLPLIVTTNLTIEEMKNPPTMQFARIYDRVLEMCPITIQMTGSSRRAGNAEARRAKARELLSGDRKWPRRKDNEP